MSDRPTLAKTYEFKRHQYPTIDGQPIPWLVHADGPLVEPLEASMGRMHVLWVPVLVDAPMPAPSAGRPDGEPLEGAE